MELLKETDIILIEQTDVVDSVHQRAQAVEPKSKRKPRIFFRVDINNPKDTRMYHSRPAHFYPAGSFADAAAGAAAFEAGVVDFSAGLNKREIRRSKANPGLRAEESSYEFFDCPFQICQRYQAVDQ